MPLTLEIVTPEARVYADTVESIVVPTVEGEIGIFPGHIPLLAPVAQGELRVTKGGASQLLAVAGGFVQVVDDVVSVLAEGAITLEKIDEHAVEDAMKRAADALKGQDSLAPAEIERLETIVRYSVAQLGLKRRHR